MAGIGDNTTDVDDLIGPDEDDDARVLTEALVLLGEDKPKLLSRVLNDPRLMRFVHPDMARVALCDNMQQFLSSTVH